MHHFAQGRGPSDTQAPTAAAAAIDVRFMWSSSAVLDWSKTGAFDRTGEFGLGAKSIAGPFGRTLQFSARPVSK
jgi:hypothetical protein